VTFFFDHDVPDDAGRVLKVWEHEVILLRDVLPRNATDAEAFAYASEHGCLLVTCNRDDFLELASDKVHPGIIILIRRQTRMAEAAHLARLIEIAGENGLRGNINFA
jgi:predicted nuclease of predicted toxin-antitoxin system